MKKVLFTAFCLLSFTGFSQTFYVSPSGKDKNPGTLEKPFATLEKAKEAAKAFAGKIPVNIWVRKGAYNLSSSFVLNNEDGGNASNPVTYAAFKDEEVVIRTSTTIAPKTVQKIKDAATLQRITARLKDSIMEIDLAALNIKNIKQFKDIFNDDGGIIELFFNGERMPLSRYPNVGNMAMKKVIINGGGQETKGDDWRNYYADGAKEQKPPRSGVFEYRDDRTKNWVSALERGVWLKGYWRIPWQNEAVRVAKIDTVNKTITLAVPVPGGIGNKYTRPEGNGKEPYYLLNLLEEIDMPGEWAIDFKDKKLYFYPPKKITDNSLRIADNATPLLQLNNTNNVAFKNFVFEENLHDGVRIYKGENNLIAGCTIKNVTKNGVTVDSGKGHTILSNDIYYTGAGGVWLRGGDEKSTPKISSEFKVVNNHIHHYSNLQKIYAAGINAGFTGGGGGGHHNCVGAYIANNMVHDAPHVGMLYGSWNNVFEYNEVFNYCLISDDMGAFYSYDLYERMGGHTFAYNFIHNSSIGDGIYFDNDHRDIKVYGNLVALNSAPKRRGTGILYKIGSQVKNPQTITCYNNMTINCNYGIEVVTTGNPNTNVFDNNVTVSCTQPITYKIVTDKARDTAATAITNGTNIIYNSDPGFLDMKGYNFNLRPDSKIFKDLPNFKPLPINKMGLFIDEYRKKLPNDKTINRFVNLKSNNGYDGTEILDRN
jgi:hypothetical protein